MIGKKSERQSVFILFSARVISYLFISQLLNRSVIGACKVHTWTDLGL